MSIVVHRQYGEAELRSTVTCVESIRTVGVLSTGRSRSGPMWRTGFLAWARYGLRAWFQCWNLIMLSECEMREQNVFNGT